MCYKEKYKGTPTIVTTCRSSSKECIKLAQRVKKGTSTLIARSEIRACTSFKGAHPSVQLGHHKDWLPSKKKGAWWTPKGCLIHQKTQHSTSPSKPLNTCSFSEDKIHPVTFKMRSLRFIEYEPSEDDEPSDCNKDSWYGKAELVRGERSVCTFEFYLTHIKQTINTKEKRDQLIQQWVGRTHKGSYNPSGFCWPELTL